MNWLREIRKIGLRDWLWFVMFLHRDEHSDKLSLTKYYDHSKGILKLSHLLKDRERAHRIDEVLSKE